MSVLHWCAIAWLGVCAVMLYFGLRSPKPQPKPEPVPMTEEERAIEVEKRLAWGRRLMEHEARIARGEPTHNPYALLAAVQIMQPRGVEPVDDLFDGAAGAVLGTAATGALIGLGVSLLND